MLADIKPFTGLHFDIGDTPLSLLADNIIVVQQVTALGSIHRILAVLKMRHSGFDATLRELIIEEHTIRVLTPPELATNVLAEAALAGGLTAPEVKPAESDSTAPPA